MDEIIQPTEPICRGQEIVPDDKEPTEATKEEPLSPHAPISSGGKSHLTSSVPKAARLPEGAMSAGELREMRSLFSGLDDTEIHRLYRRVTKEN